MSWPLASAWQQFVMAIQDKWVLVSLGEGCLLPWYTEIYHDFVWRNIKLYTSLHCHVLPLHLWEQYIYIHIYIWQQSIGVFNQIFLALPCSNMQRTDLSRLRYLLNSEDATHHVKYKFRIELFSNGSQKFCDSISSLFVTITVTYTFVSLTLFKVIYYFPN